MTAIPSSAIRLAYLLPCNAVHAAGILNDRYKTRISACALRERWQSEAAVCTPLRELGERPEKGFLASEKVSLVKRLVVELVE
jgi:hypothetical protein